MIIHLATDHAGFEHKKSVALWLRTEGFEVMDHGAHEYDALDDFPDYIAKAAVAVNKNPGGSKAIIFGGSGQGEAMMANSYSYVRAAVYYGGEETIPVLSRHHNNSNVLSIGARFVDIDTAKKVIWEWLQAKPLEDEKYKRRNKKIADITNSLHS
jgi:ribose 5-phosphate isomerase B